MRGWRDSEHVNTAYGAFALALGLFAAVCLIVGLAVALAWVAEAVR